MRTGSSWQCYAPHQWDQSCGSRAGEKTNEEREQTLNQLLSEMDGFTVDQGVVFVAATNRIDLLDPAILRAGRFDEKVRIARPSTEGRFDILKVLPPISHAQDLLWPSRKTSGHAP